MIQQGCDAALETLPADMEADEKPALMKKTYNTLILCLGDWVLREVTKETTAAGIWTKLTSLYMTKSLANRLYLKKKNDEMTELVMDSGGSYHMTHRRDFLYDFKVVDGGLVQLDDNRTCTIKGTRIRKENCVYTLKAKVMNFGVQKHGGPKQVGLKQLGSKQVGFKQLGHKQVGFKQLGPCIKTGVYGVQDEKRVWFEVKLQGAQGDREAEVFQVSNDDAAVAQRRLGDKQPEEKTNMDCLVKE
ncbi:hypothetical protein Tco_0939131 [Tanacetum coccineum]|uniref:Retrovirus-related Pol polyprotein from transposon TNT 1-94-like beta-barrel domain-containing protein n=1 Tax=Tanacetum coccineum TaxID=301880 RepID=A0ABQ5DJ65_9ASTR